MNKRSEIITIRTLLGLFIILVAVSPLVFSGSSSQRGLHFEDKSVVLDFRRGGGEGLGGAAWLDFDQDDDLDLFLTNSQNIGNTGQRFENGLFRNNSDGSFTNVSQQAGVANGLGVLCR